MKAQLMELQCQAGWPQSRNQPNAFLTELVSPDMQGVIYTHLLTPARDLSYLL